MSAERLDERGFAGARRPGDADPQPGLRRRWERRKQFPGLRLMLLQAGFDQRDRLCQRSPILIPDSVRQRGHIIHADDSRTNSMIC